jgi:hypothetical protein
VHDSDWAAQHLGWAMKLAVVDGVANARPPVLIWIFKAD